MDVERLRELRMMVFVIYIFMGSHVAHKANLGFESSAFRRCSTRSRFRLFPSNSAHLLATTVAVPSPMTVGMIVPCASPAHAPQPEMV